MKQFVIASRAQADLEAIDAYLSARSADAADRVIDELYASFSLLAEQPGSGRLRPEWTVHDLRFWSVPRFPNYVVIYEHAVSPIRIVRILHGALDVPMHL